MARASANQPAKKTRTALIDADGILWVQALGAEMKVFDGEVDMFLQVRTAEEAYWKVRERIEEIMEVVGADNALICLSDRDNFRYGVLPTYKCNRHEQRRPLLLTELRNLLQERKPHPVVFVKGLEADDVCGISASTLRTDTRETVICSPDKDLRQIPGLYYACRNDSKVERITTEEADRFHMYQTLVGDPVDGYTGCPKVGPVRAAKVLDEVCADMAPAGRWQAVVAEFTSRGLSEEYALTQARVARILRAEDWNSEKREVRLWQPPMGD